MLTGWTWTDVSDFLREWGSLLVTTMLAALTAWYAVLTRSIAKASADAAKSSAEAAQAALDAANAARSALVIGFRVSPLMFSQDDRQPGFSGVEVTCSGDNLYVHGVDLCSVTEAQPPSSGEHNISYVTVAGEELPLLTDEQVPRLLHKGEAMKFWLPQDHSYRVRGGAAKLLIKVHYSLNGAGRVDLVEARYP